MDKREALPNADKTTAAKDKFTQYLFGGTNADGLAKGRALQSRLGYNIDSWEDLQQEILTRATKYPATLRDLDEYGTAYTQKIILYGNKGKPANVIVGWKTQGDKTWMTSAYIKEVERHGKN